jgi:RNA polymerase sigma-70 factor (ECF subfamily)
VEGLLAGTDAVLEEHTTFTPEVFAARYAERVHRFAEMVASPGVDPQDLAQEALIKALRNLARFDPTRGTVEAWLWRIVVNVSRDGGRVTARFEGMVERLALRQRDEQTEASAESVALRNISDQELLAAVRRLPKRYRSIIALRFGGGLTYPEIADALGTTRMTVVQAMRRALVRLRDQLEEPN